VFFLSSLNILIYCLVPAFLFLCMEAGVVNKQDLPALSRAGREIPADTQSRLSEYVDHRTVIRAEERPESGRICPEKPKSLFRCLIRSGGETPGTIGLRAPPHR
jgi:hypothetical protein